MSTSSTIWIQWKGTNACFDIHCECGEGSHFDGYQAYAIRCPHCERQFDVQQTVELLPYSGVFTAVEANP